MHQRLSPKAPESLEWSFRIKVHARVLCAMTLCLPLLSFIIGAHIVTSGLTCGVRVTYLAYKHGPLTTGNLLARHRYTCLSASCFCEGAFPAVSDDVTI